MVARDKGIAFYFPADVTADLVACRVHEYKGSFNCFNYLDTDAAENTVL